LQYFLFSGSKQFVLCDGRFPLLLETELPWNASVSGRTHNHTYFKRLCYRNDLPKRWI